MELYLNEFPDPRYNLLKVKQTFHKYFIDPTTSELILKIVKDSEGRVIGSDCQKHPFLWAYYYSDNTKDLLFAYSEHKISCVKFLYEYQKVQIDELERTGYLVLSHKYAEYKQYSTPAQVKLIIPHKKENLDLVYGIESTDSESIIYVPQPILNNAAILNLMPRNDHYILDMENEKIALHNMNQISSIYIDKSEHLIDLSKINFHATNLDFTELELPY